MANLHAVPSGPDEDAEPPVDVDEVPAEPVADEATDGITDGTTDGATDGPTDGPTGGATDGDVPDAAPEQLEPDEPPEEPEERRYPSTIGGAFYLSILAVSCVAIVIAARSDWRLGIQILGGALAAGALLRLLLSPKDAGMLAVRNRFLDAFLLGGLGTALIVLAASLPHQPS